MKNSILYFFSILFFVSCGNGSPKVGEIPADNSMIQPARDSIAGEVAQASEPIITNQSAKGNSGLPDQFINPVDGSVQIKIPAGKFIYGINKNKRNELLKEMRSPKEEIFDYEFQEENISLPSFYIDKYEVTNEQFLKFLKETGYNIPAWPKQEAIKNPKLPVTNIGWQDARAYAKWTGKHLPSEKEWEKAARGTDGRMWPWGNNPSGEMYNGHAQAYFRPVEVGSYPKGVSPYGAMDMAGNVYEMTTGDWVKSGYAMRGGSFLNNGAYTRTMFRWSPNDTVNGDVWLGFRCAMDSMEVVKILSRENKK